MTLSEFIVAWVVGSVCGFIIAVGGAWWWMIGRRRYLVRKDQARAAAAAEAIARAINGRPWVQGMLTREAAAREAGGER